MSFPKWADLIERAGEIFRGAFSPVNVFNRGISTFGRQQSSRRWIGAVPYPLQFTIQAQTEESA